MEQRPPQKLYKYVGEKTALLILGSGQIQFSVPQLFNDDFDCNVGFSISYNSQIFQEKLLKAIFSIAFDQIDISNFNPEIVRLAGGIRRFAPAQFVANNDFIDEYLNGEENEEIQHYLLSSVEKTCDSLSDQVINTASQSKFCCFSEVSIRV